MHFAHAITVSDFVLIWDNLRILSHQLDAVHLGHELLSWSEVRSVDLCEVSLIGLQDLVGLIAPPSIVSELLPLPRWAESEAIVVEEHLKSLCKRRG